MEAYTIIDRLSATTKRTEKEQIIMDAFMQGHRDFFIGAKLAYDILISFGVKKVAEIKDLDDDSAGDFTFGEFLKLAEDLRYRRLTGYAARDAIYAAADRCHIPTWNTFYRRILLKDFRCGIDTSTINKVLGKLAQTEPDAKKLMIPVFSCQLAHDGTKPEHQKRLTGNKMLDVKLDGVRLITILNKDEKTVTQYARNGKVNENFTEIRKGLESLLDELPGSIVLDGEIVAQSFQELMKQFSRSTSKADTSASRLAVFDIIPLNDFKAGICKVPQHTRHSILAHMETNGDFKKHTNGLVYVIPKVSVDMNHPDDYKTFLEFNQQAITAGYEGIMVKDPDAPYVLKRSSAWLKIKPFFSYDLTVVDYAEGEGKYENILGALICEGEDDGKKIKVRVGSGFTDEERRELWDKRDALIGQIIEIIADSITIESGSDSYSLRFPRFHRFRSIFGQPNIKY